MSDPGELLDYLVWMGLWLSLAVVGYYLYAAGTKH